MSKTNQLRIFVEDLGVFVSISERLVRWITDLDFFAIMHNTGFDLVLAYVALCRG